MGEKPLFVVRLDGTGFYSLDASWRTVPIDEATRFTHKEAVRTANYMRQPRIGFTAAEIVAVKPTEPAP